jgi:pyruvate kinase
VTVPIRQAVAVEQLARLGDQVDDLLRRLSDAEATWQQLITETASESRASARNLVHYWALRQVDLRQTQSELSHFGLSSLGRSEPHVQATLRLVSCAIAAMRGTGWCPSDDVAASIDDGGETLRLNAVELLGQLPAGRAARIMVTLPSEAAIDRSLAHDLVEAGMNIARINCAHDAPQAWRAMAENVRAAARSANTPCLIAMDLGGPKLRTGPLEPGPRVVRLHPRRNALGRVVTAARGWITSAENPATPPETGMATLPVADDWLRRRRTGDVITLVDTRGAYRRLQLSIGAGGFVVTTDKTTYLATGTVLSVDGVDDDTGLAEMAPTEQSLTLHAGDILHLTRDCSPARVDAQAVPRIGCTLPEVFDQARVGETVFLDDGKLRGEIIATEPDVLLVRIDNPPQGSAKLKAGKGINLPDTNIPISALTRKDLQDLETVVDIADVVELSFVRYPSDIEQLLGELERLGNRRLGIVLKIETREAFERLPELVLTAMRRRRIGVMIARGDLAVECGYERMAEVQEEILWLCEAAHLPVIWATQVLEQLAKRGVPSRAEISDAAMGERAECVMLNKGPYVNDAVAALDNILRRMTSHHYKKNALLRTLHSWGRGSSARQTQRQ